jgi:hypothetical protein
MAALRDLPFTRRNWTLLAVGLATIALGYLALGVPPADGFLSLTLAPLLLVAGYCVLIPLALLAREKKDQDPPARRSS